MIEFIVYEFSIHIVVAFVSCIQLFESHKCIGYYRGIQRTITVTIIIIINFFFDKDTSLLLNYRE